MIVIKTDQEKKGVFTTESIYTDTLPGYEERIKQHIENAKEQAKIKGYKLKIEKL